MESCSKCNFNCQPYGGCKSLNLIQKRTGCFFETVRKSLKRAENRLLLTCHSTTVIYKTRAISLIDHYYHCCICYLLNLFILCIIHLEPPGLDCFVYIRQDATQSYLEVLFYSIGAFNELQECSLLRFSICMAFLRSARSFFSHVTL